MSKKKLDNLLWYIIYALPLLLCLVLSLKGSPDTILAFIQDNFSLIENNIIYNIFSDVIGENGVFPIFVGQWKLFIYYSVYFFGINLLHILIDIVLFLPRICMSFMEDFGSKTGGH